MTTFFQVRVVSKRIEARDIFSFELASLDGSALPPFSAGSHIDVRIDATLTRQYSLCNDPQQTHRYQIAVLKDPASRGGSNAMHERVQAGGTLEISAPKNHFELAHDAPHSLLLAGGIGITPILCMAERLSTIGASFALHYCTRSRERTAFREGIAQATFAPRVRFHIDDETPELRLDLERILRGAPGGTHLYVCGPKGFMDAVLAAARGAGWPESQLHYEFFTADLPKLVDERSFEVKLARSGRLIAVAPDQTVVQALQEAGVQIPISCEQGICGTCITRVLEGEPDHRDLFLTLAEQACDDQFTPCCSRAKSPILVLDL
jgi:vanillate O-demethylase ferredoxin subunit